MTIHWAWLLGGLAIGAVAGYAACNVPALTGGRGWGAIPKPRIA